MIQNSWSIKLEEQPKYFVVCTLQQPTIIYQSASHLITHSNKKSFRLPIRKEVLAIQYLTPLTASNISVQQGYQQPCHLLLLTRYQLLCFDLLNNNEVFKLQFENCQKMYKCPPFLYVVCGSDIYCYSVTGEQQNVNHLPSAIDCMLAMPDNTVIVAMEDSTMVKYRGANIVLDYGKIIGKVCCMVSIGNGLMIGIEEGTIAYYQGKKYKWKAKSSHKPLQIIKFITSNCQLSIVGRVDGLIEVRNWSNGDNISKIKIGQDLIGMQIYDYRNQGFQQLMCVCVSGTVKVFNINETQKIHQPTAILVDEGKIQVQDIQKLNILKAALQFEVNTLKGQLDTNNIQTDVQVLGPDFVLSAKLQYEGGLVVKVGCNKGYISGLSFEEPILPFQNSQKSSQLTYKFTNENAITGQINCEALVHANFLSKEYQIKQFKVMLPKLWKWGYFPKNNMEIQGFVKLKLNERNSRYIKWLQECFIVNLTEEQKSKMEAVQMLKFKFFNAYENQGLQIIIVSKQSRLQIWCDCLRTLGDIVQDLVSYIQVKELDSELSFPKQKQSLKQTLSTIQKLSQAKVSISSEMSEAINQQHQIFISERGKFKNSGQKYYYLGNIKELRKSYKEVMEQNGQLMTEITKKNQNTKQLAQELKILGQIINQTSNVRHGQSKTKIITLCRQAIKTKDFQKIISIMERGASSF